MSKKFIVTITSTSTADIPIEADSRAEAEERAIELAKKRYPNVQLMMFSASGS